MCLLCTLSRCGPKAVASNAFQPSHLGVLTSTQGTGKGAMPRPPCLAAKICQFLGYYILVSFGYQRLTTEREGGGRTGIFNNCIFNAWLSGSSPLWNPRPQQLTFCYLWAQRGPGRGNRAPGGYSEAFSIASTWMGLMVFYFFLCLPQGENKEWIPERPGPLISP